MSFLSPKAAAPPAPPPPPTVDSAAAATDQANASQRAALAAGEQAFNPTGGLGDPSAAPTQKKSLLGS